jgi:hypothetical protein
VTLITLSIVYMALENIIGAWFNGSLASALRWRWVITGGFGFSFVLQENLQFTGGIFLLSLLALALHGVQAQRAGVAVLSVLVAHTAWHWMLERMAALKAAIVVKQFGGTVAGGRPTFSCRLSMQAGSCRHSRSFAVPYGDCKEARPASLPQ